MLCESSVPHAEREDYFWIQNMSDAKTLLELIDVSKTYDSVNGFVTKGERQTDPISVLQHISLQVKAGESVAIIGSSGSGKSTLLNIMGSLDKATSGRVLLDSKDLSSLDDNALAQMRNCQIGFIFQSHHLLPQCTVLENVLGRRFPIYREGDTNAGPLGKTRQLQYKLVPGEAGWILRLTDITEY